MIAYDSLQYDISVRKIAETPNAADEVLISGSSIFETGSAIKAPIAALTYQEADEQGHDPNVYEYAVGPNHYSNGSGQLKNGNVLMPGFLTRDMRAANGTCRATLGSLVLLNLRDSDCMATNALIDYLGDRRGVNARLKDFSLSDMELVTDRLHFPGVDHVAVPYQVGTATMDAFTSFYAGIANNNLGLPALSQEALLQDLDNVARTHLLNTDTKDLPEWFSWKHKTGSIIDDIPDRTDRPFYATLVDAGLLTVGSDRYAVAAAITAMREDGERIEGESLSVHLKAEFGMRNRAALARVAIPLPELLVAA